MLSYIDYHDQSIIKVNGKTVGSLTEEKVGRKSIWRVNLKGNLLDGSLMGSRETAKEYLEKEVD